MLYPSKSSATFPVEQTAPGIYSITFAAEETGEYYLSLYPTNRLSEIGTEVFGFTIPYGDEFRSQSVNYPLLHELAEMTGGRTLTTRDESDFLFTVNPPRKETKSNLWPYLLALFLFFLILDVLIRRVNDKNLLF